MRDGLLQLLELQEIDRELQALEDAKQKYPLEISNGHREIELAERVLRTYTEDLARANARQRQLERDLEAAKEDLKEHEARFAEVTNNREYDALQIEIESARTRIAECETQILEMIETAEKLQQEVEAERNRCEEVTSGQRARIEEMEAKLAVLQQEVDEVETRRRIFAEKVDPALVRLYERIRKKPGTRVAPVRKGACSSCFRELPAQHRSNVRRNEQPYFCEYCGALLVWDADSN